MKWTKIAALFVVALLAATSGFAQTNGRIQGAVKDSNGAALPGVTLTATATQLPGNVTAVTSDDGAFRLLNLPPGMYTVSAVLDGFNTVEQRDIKVGIDRTVTLELTMTAAFAGELTVLGDAPVVDTSSVTAGVSVNSDTFERIPMTRDFYAVAQVATGASADASGTTVYGSTGAENAYVIEGLNTTGVELGGEAKTLNFDFLQEVEIKTGGLPAEYGRLTGGLINAITKSGGNDFSGDLFGFYEGGDLQSDDSTRSDRSHDATQIVDTDSRSELGFDLGGFIVKDKLWFFVAYNKVDRTDATTVINEINSPNSPVPGTIIDADIAEDLYAGKLTYRINSSNNLAFSIFGDPTTREGNIFNIQGPASTWNGKRETGSDDFVLRYDGVFGGSWVVEALAGLHQEEDFTYGAGKSIPNYIDTRPNGPDALSGGFGFHQDQEFEREVFKLDVSKFVGNFEFKFGADNEHTSAVNANWNGGAGQRIYILKSRTDPDGPPVYRHRYYIDDQVAGFDQSDPSTWVIAAPLVSEPDSVSTAAYAQTSWKVMPNLTLNLGFRWESQEINDRFGESSIKIDDNYAPRLAFIWDPQANGRSKLFGSFGRYYENIPMDINIRAFGGEVQAFAYNFDPSPNAIVPLPDGAGGFRNSTLGGTTPVDPNLEGQYIDEFLVGYEYEILPNFAIGIQGTYRELGQVIEDFLISPTTGYFIANPGQGIGSDMTFYNYDSVAAPSVKREYTGIELNARKRYSNGWQLYASYLWSELEGNYDGLFQASTGQLDPNINSAFDYADFLINADGKLSNDRTHQFKTSGSYTVQDGPLTDLTVGVSAYWRSGTPQTAYGYSPGYQNWEYYLTPRGSVGRNPDDYEMDLHFDYPIKVGDYEIQLLVDVFNLLDRQAIINYDQRYNENGDSCGGVPFGLCAGDVLEVDEETGEVTEVRGSGALEHSSNGTQPLGQLPGLTPSNPSFLNKARNDASFTGQRNIRVGVRFRF